MHTSNVTGRQRGPKRKRTFVCRYVAPPVSVITPLYYVAISFHHQVWYLVLSLCYACIHHHPHPLGYLCAKFRFLHGLHCWASPWRKTAYSLTHSLIHPAYLMCREPKRFGIITIIIQVSHGLSSLKIPTHAHFLQQVILTRKVGQTDLVLACDRGSLVGPYTQDFKSLCAAVAICSTLVNMQTLTHTQTAFDQLIWSAQPIVLMHICVIPVVDHVEQLWSTTEYN